MVRFNDKTQISSLASNDIMPITDMSDSTNDKKVTIGQLSDYINNAIPSNKFANLNLSNLSTTGQAILDSKLNQNQIANCVLEVPDVINISLENEILIVKSGTILYDADGNTATLNNDRSVTLTLTSRAQVYVLINKSTQGITTASVTDSRLSFTDNKVIFADVEYYLPLAVVTRDTQGYSKIDYIFNGSGYFLNNSFILPNVKGLYPNYRNEDGTLKNELSIIPNVLTKSHSADGDYYLIARETAIFFIDKRFYLYNQEENMAYRTSDNISLKYFIFAEAKIVNGKITSFKSRNTLSLIDYNNFIIENEKKLNNNQIANCILKIPQDINIQKNGEIITVKSGTKLYDASGNIFTLNNDKSMTLTFTSAAKCYLLIKKTDLGLLQISINDSKLTFAGNKVMYNGTECWLPLGIVTRNIEGKSTLDQIFNGIGYIKNNNYLLPNVKMLIAHGYNSDGTYNNVEYITNEVMISYHTFSENTIMFFRKLSSGILQTDNISQSSYLGELNYTPDIDDSKFEWYYNEVDRLWYSHEASESSWAQIDYINLATSTSNSTPPIDTIRIMNYNDGLSGLICTIAPNTTSTASSKKPAVVIKNYVNGTSGYFIRSDGYCEQWGYVDNISNAGSTISFLKNYVNTNYNITIGRGNLNSNLNENIQWRDKTISQITLFVETGTMNADWKVCGYIK